jgi:hypothetical protein
MKLFRCIRWFSIVLGSQLHCYSTERVWSVSGVKKVSSTLKMTAFWDVAPCSQILTDISEEFGASITMTICTRLHGANIPEDGHLHSRRENLKSHLVYFVPGYSLITC